MEPEIHNPFLSIDLRLSRIENLLLELKRRDSEPCDSNDAWFNIDELIAYLPDKPKKSTVYDWTRRGLIPTHKGANQKKLRFLKSEIDAWLKTQRRRNLIDLDSEAKRYIEMRKTQ